MTVSGDEKALLARLRGGDDGAFASLVDDLHGRLLAFAGTFTASRSLAEDIVQETWLAVIRGLDAFEERCALRTWIFSILVRRARTLAGREASRVDAPGRASDVNGQEFVEWSPGQGRLGLWESTPVPWTFEDPAWILQSHEAWEVLRGALADLPERQRQVVLLRDVEDVSVHDVCNILDLSETNMRVLLHRGRARIRRALDRYVRDGIGAVSPRGAWNPNEETR